MVIPLKILFVCFVSHFASYFILAKLTPFKQELRTYFISSVTIVAAAVLLRSVFVAYLAAFFLSLHFTRGKDASVKLSFLLGCAFVLPNDSGIFLNFGINLGELSYFKILVFALVLPLIFRERKNPEMKQLHIIDYAVFFFIGWQFLLNFRFGNITATMRTDLWLIVEYLLPYLAIRFYLKNHLLAFVSIAFALSSQMFVAISEAGLSWRLYESIKQISGYDFFAFTMYKYRWGFLRVEAAFGNPLVLSLFSNFAFLAAFLIYKKEGFEPPKTYSRLLALGLMGAAFGGTFFTGSRAGLTGIALILFIYFLLAKGVKMKRDPKNKLIALTVFVLVLFSIFGGDFIKEADEYRYRLFEVSQGVIASNFFTGSPSVLEDPRMEVLRQGEGIIDLVNSYIYFALYYGMPAMLALLVAFFGGILKTYSALRETEGPKYTLGMFGLCSLAILSFNMATTSPLGWTYLWIWIILALCSNIVATVAADKRAKSPKPSLF